MKQEKQPIGEVTCSHRGCEERCKVFRFQPRSDRGSMFKGKVYADCPVHGRIGADGRQAMQDYIMENATIWGASGKPVEPEKEPAKPVPAPAVKPAQSSKAPAPEPEPKKTEPETKPVSKADTWGPLIQ